MCRNVRSIEWHQKTYHEISWDYPFKSYHSKAAFYNIPGTHCNIYIYNPVCLAYNDYFLHLKSNPQCLLLLIFAFIMKQCFLWFFDSFFTIEYLLLVISYLKHRIVISEYLFGSIVSFLLYSIYIQWMEVKRQEKKFGNFCGTRSMIDKILYIHSYYSCIATILE
jgi:hypothetical protein